MAGLNLSEAEFSDLIVGTAKRFGWLVAHFHAAQVKPGRWVTPVSADGKGYPDLTLVRERVLFVELKGPIGRVRPDQQNWLDALRRAGQEVYVWAPVDFDAAVRILSGARPLDAAAHQGA